MARKGRIESPSAVYHVAKPMHYLTRLAVLFSIGWLLVACAGVASGKHPEFYSDRLSADDISQIKELVAHRPDIRQPVYEITTEEGSPNRATVHTGRWLRPGDQSDYFQVEKRRGRWRIISPIWHDRLKTSDFIKVS